MKKISKVELVEKNSIYPILNISIYKLKELWMLLENVSKRPKIKLYINNLLINKFCSYEKYSYSITLILSFLLY
jgi:hypothetical protein